METDESDRRRKRQKLTHPEKIVKIETLPGLVEAASRLYPLRTALEYVEYDQATAQGTRTTVTYAQLMALVARIRTALLVRYKVQRGQVIGVLGPASDQLVAALLAVMQCGAAGMPLDAHHSRATDQLALVITTRELSTAALVGDAPCMTLPFADSDELALSDTTVRASDTTVQASDTTVQASDTAYVMWTSGTTRSKPTRVTVPHSCVLPNLHSLADALGVNTARPLTTVLVAPLTFDPSMIDLFLALSCAGTVVVPSLTVKLLPSQFLAAIYSHRVSCLQATPSFIRRMPLDLRRRLFAADSPLCHVILGGEQFPTVGELRQWMGPAYNRSLRVYNIYGVTEVSVWATLEEINIARLPRKPDHYVPPLGYPLDGTELALMDDTEALVPLAPFLARRRTKRQAPSDSAPGTHTMTGRLLIGGSRWCLLDDEPAPQPWRETGDLVRVVNGKVYFVCRAHDYLIKVNGKKINLLEVSNVLQSCPGVRDITVLSVALNDDTLLACFAVSDANEPVHSINNFARTHLPDFMRPNRVVMLEILPTTANGKLDKRALIQLFHDQLASTASAATDRESIELCVQQLWLKALNREALPHVQGQQYFVALGGTSLAVFECVQDLVQHYGWTARTDDVRQRLQDALIHRPFERVVELVHSELHSGPATTQAVASTTAVNTALFAGQPLRAISRGNQVTAFHPAVDQSNAEPVQLSATGTDISLQWKQWLVKCIDASPLVIETDQQRYVVIGSHSGHVVCLAATTGAQIWSTVLPGRVESSATLVRTDNGFVVAIGCYDHRIYFLTVESGEVAWSYDLQGQVKSSAAQDLSSGLVWIGAHSGTLAVLDVTARECRMRRTFTAPLFAVPAVDSLRGRVYVAAEDNKLYAFNGATLAVEWDLDLQAPLFSSPLVTRTGVIVIGGVNNVISAVSGDGTILWQHTTSAPVFSSPALVLGHNQATDAVVCGTHDGHVCCLALDGSLKWRVRIGDKAIFSSLFVGHMPNTAPLIAACDTTGAIHLLNGEGVTLTRVTCLGEVFSSPVLVDASLIVGCRDDHLYCFQLA